MNRTPEVCQPLPAALTYRPSLAPLPGMRVKLAQKRSKAVPAVLENGRLAQYCPLWPPESDFAKNGGGQNARATGGPGILPET